MAKRYTQKNKLLGTAARLVTPGNIYKEGFKAAVYEGLNQAEKVTKPGKSSNHEIGEFCIYYLKS